MINFGHESLKFGLHRHIDCEYYGVVLPSELPGGPQDFGNGFISFAEEVPPTAINWKIHAHLGVDEGKAVQKLLTEFPDCFYRPEKNLTSTSAVQHRIDVGDPVSIRERGVIGNQVQRGADERNRSTIILPLVVAGRTRKKKFGQVHFCVDYRRLYSVTKTDVYPLPRIENVLDRLGGFQYFSSLDLACGYWQVKMDEAHQEKTAFISSPKMACMSFAGCRSDCATPPPPSNALWIGCWLS